MAETLHPLRGFGESVDPIAYIERIMSERGLERRDLRAALGSSGRASEIFNRRRALSLNHIRALVAHYDMDANVLVEWYPLQPYEIGAPDV